MSGWDQRNDLDERPPLRPLRHYVLVYLGLVAMMIAFVRAL